MACTRGDSRANDCRAMIRCTLLRACPRNGRLWPKAGIGDLLLVTCVKAAARHFVLETAGALSRRGTPSAQ